MPIGEGRGEGTRGAPHEIDPDVERFSTNLQAALDNVVRNAANDFIDMKMAMLNKLEEHVIRLNISNAQVCVLPIYIYMCVYNKQYVLYI